MDSPWSRDNDGWGTSPGSWGQSSSSGANLGSGSGWGTEPRERKQEPEVDGWGIGTACAVSAPPPAEATPTKQPLAESDYGWESRPGEEEESWLSAGPSSAELPLEPSWHDIEEPDESWLDQDDEFSDLLDREPDPVSTGGVGLWLAVVTIGLLLVFGLWSLTGKESKPEVDPKVAAIAEALESGRLLTEAGRESLDKGEAESAASQLRKGVADLKSGQAPAEEVWEARRLLGKAAFRSRQFEEAHVVWTQLAAQKSFQAEAKLAIKQAAVELRKQANAKLNQAGTLLGQGDAAAAAALAKESLSIYQRFGGDRTQLGRANGALGSALAKQGRLSTARSYLAAAKAYWPENSSYAVALADLGAGPYEPLPEIELPAPVTSKVVPSSVNPEPWYPIGPSGGGGSSGGGSQKPAVVDDTPKPDVNPRPAPPQPSPKSKPKPVKPPRSSDVLPSYVNSGGGQSVW